MLKIAKDHLESLKCINNAITQLEQKEINHRKSLKIIEDIVKRMGGEATDQLDTLASMKRIIEHQISYLQTIADRFTS